VALDPADLRPRVDDDASGADGEDRVPEQLTLGGDRLAESGDAPIGGCPALWFRNR
jgi:hypothetical protein